jgi:hypothetical protein
MAVSIIPNLLKLFNENQTFFGHPLEGGRYPKISQQIKLAQALLS